MTDRSDPPTRPERIDRVPPTRTQPGRPDLRPPTLPAARAREVVERAQERLDYRAEITLAILVVGGLIARALGSDELAIALVAGALGYAQRSGVSARATKAATALVFVVAMGATLVGCGPAFAPAVAQGVKVVLDGAVWSCGVIEPVCDAAELACRFVPGAPQTSGGDLEAP